MKKRILALLLAVCLGLTPALAAETGQKFPHLNTYTDGQFGDVKTGDWFADTAKLCYETGLMNGTDKGFEPSKTLTVAECAAVAARIREALTGEAILSSTPLPGETKAWYTDYVNYMARDTGLAAILSRPTETITRMEYFQLLHSALPAEEDLLTPINAITSLPDTQDADVLSFYNAGILTGADAYGTFAGDRELTRAECAAMVARLIDPALRKTFTPETKPAQPEQSGQSGQKPALSPEEELMQTEAVRVNGATITFAQLIDTMNQCVDEVAYALQQNGGETLDWNKTYGDVDDLPMYFKQMAVSRAVESTVLSTQARVLGCSVDDLPAALTPDPSKALDKVYCAKHILLATKDATTGQEYSDAKKAEQKALADGIIALIQATPSLATFNSLLSQYGEDPGMTSNPNGYLFTDGEMVSEFENAVKALKIGSCSTVPVKSSFGYHIILRLDPTTYPGWQQAVQEMMYQSYLNAWMSSATVTTNDAELDKLDVPGRYAAYLASKKS